MADASNESDAAGQTSTSQEVMLGPPPREGFLGRLGKRYALFQRKLKSKISWARISVPTSKYINQVEAEALVPDGFEEGYEYGFAEERNSQPVKFVWTRRIPILSGDGNKRKPAWDRLNDDLEEAIKPLEAVGNAANKLADALDKIRNPGGAGQGGEGGFPPDGQAAAGQQFDPVQKALDTMQNTYIKMFEAMATSMGNMANQMMFPWMVPSNWPMTAQMIMHPGFRAGVKEFAKEIVDDLSSGSEAITGAVYKSMLKTQQEAGNGKQAGEPPKLQELAQKFRKPSPQKEETSGNGGKDVTQIPEGEVGQQKNEQPQKEQRRPRATRHITKVVAPPPDREDEDENEDEEQGKPTESEIQEEPEKEVIQIVEQQQ